MMPCDILITLPATIQWKDYRRELEAVADRSSVMHFKVPTLPVHPVVGGRCYVVHRGVVAGWLEITGTHSGAFTCTTTGLRWDGNFIERSGAFHAMAVAVPHRGFQGWRYLPRRPDEQAE